MKKIFVMAALVIAAATVNAQSNKWYVGTTGISLGSTGNEGLVTGVATNGDNTSWGIAPEVGFNLNEKITLGLGIGYSSFGEDNNNFGVNPFIRWYGWRSGNFAAYLQGNVEYFNNKAGDTKINSLGVNIAPGVAYSLSDHWGINAAFGKLGYDKVKGNDGVFSFQLNSGVAFSLTYAF